MHCLYTRVDKFMFEKKQSALKSTFSRKTDDTMQEYILLQAVRPLFQPNDLYNVCDIVLKRSLRGNLLYI